MDKNADDRIAADERQELHELRIQADQLMLRKAYAWALLLWHGHPLNLEPNQRYSLTRKPVTNTQTAWDLLEESAGSLEMPSDWSQEHDHEHLNRI